MNEERQHILKQAFPLLYGGLHGLECGDGWYTLLSDLGRALDGLPVSAVQVKEKFGTLRVYWSSEEDLSEQTRAFIDAVVGEAEQASGATCEECGSPGSMVRGSWWRTLCMACEQASKGF
jgi:hypothetical protein